MLGTRSSPEATESALAQYKAYLDAVRELLPPAAYEFASTPWHYDYRDHRCPHDRDKNPAFGAFHDGYLKLTYPNVWAYSFNVEKRLRSSGHGDWITDEVRLSEEKVVLHEIVLRTGRWTIAADLLGIGTPGA